MTKRDRERMEVYPYNDHEVGAAHQSTRQLTWLHDRLV